VYLGRIIIIFELKSFFSYHSITTFIRVKYSFRSTSTSSKVWLADEYPVIRGTVGGSAWTMKSVRSHRRVFLISSAVRHPLSPSGATAANGRFHRGKRIGRHNGFGGFRNRCGTMKIINQMADSSSGGGGCCRGLTRGWRGGGWRGPHSVRRPARNGNGIEWESRVEDNSFAVVVRGKGEGGSHKRKLETRPVRTPRAAPHLYIDCHSAYTHRTPVCPPSYIYIYIYTVPRPETRNKSTHEPQK